LALFRGARIEMRKVRWPTKEEATKSTLVVLALVALFAIVLSIFDWILVKIVEALL
jgi:preprotein translocase, secE subunit